MKMDYIVGIILALSMGALGTFAAFDRDRAYYPTALIVIASYYCLFAIMGGDGHVLVIELAVALLFAVFAVIGFRVNLWLVVAGLLGHTVLDFFVHQHVVTNPGMPLWWPMFCGAFDAVAGLFLAWRLMVKRVQPLYASA
jgi:hypothetical protein